MSVTYGKYYKQVRGNHMDNMCLRALMGIDRFCPSRQIIST
jgi:DNA-directed RNA polymerase subunit N (RpoN/RPB10)